LPRAVIILAVLQIGLTFAGQQMAYWNVDVEFNAGGRYMLATLAAIALLLVVGLSRLGRPGRAALALWLAALPLMNVLSMWNLLAVLNPRYAPTWHVFRFPPGEERD
jgi:hypothetical protein